MKQRSGATAPPRTGYLPLAIAIACMPLAGNELLAQPFDLTLPSDSVVWWPSTDEISSAELHRQLTDPQEMAKRYTAATGKQPRKEFAYFVDSTETPELVPLYRLLLHFRAVHAPEADPRIDEARFSAEQRAAVYRFFSDLRIEVEQIKERGRVRDTHLARLREDFISVEANRQYSSNRSRSLETAREKVEDQIGVAAQGNDTKLLADTLGLSKAESREMMKNIWRNAPLEAMEIYLPSLRSDLGSSGWNIFRRVVRESTLPLSTWSEERASPSHRAGGGLM